VDTVTVTVRYGADVDVEQARRCHRCEGGGRERYGIDAGKPCPRCSGTGEHADGWAYRIEGLVVMVGDVVEVPHTPRSVPGRPQLATIVRVGSELPSPRSAVLRVVRQATE
jgi:hypothetical protein